MEWDLVTVVVEVGEGRMLEALSSTVSVVVVVIVSLVVGIVRNGFVVAMVVTDAATVRQARFSFSLDRVALLMLETTTTTTMKLTAGRQ